MGHPSFRLLIWIALLYRHCIQGKWKQVLTYDGAVNRRVAVHLRTEKGPQLYDLENNPHEFQNLEKVYLQA